MKSYYKKNKINHKNKVKMVKNKKIVKVKMEKK